MKSVYARCHHGQLLEGGCPLCRDENGGGVTSFIEAVAIVWYATDFDVSIEQARRNIAKGRDAEHYGDCTKCPLTCMRCTVDEAFKAARQIEALMIWHIPTIASSVLVDALLSTIMADIVAGKWFSDIASQRNVTVELVRQLAYQAQARDIAICHECKGSGTVNSTQRGPLRCDQCGGSGWIGKSP